MRDTQVILAKDINLDPSYSNVLDYSETNMINLMLNENHVTYQASNYQFIRENENQINVNAPYDTCLNSNYLAFKNTHYSNKWFFCFITDVKFNSNSSTTITFQVDVFTTWHNSLTYKPVFVEREHVNDDIAGNYTLPEGHETGEYITRSSGVLDYKAPLTPVFSGNDAWSVVMAVTLDDELFSDVTSIYYGGCFSGTAYIEFSGTYIIHASAFIKAMNSAGKLDAITGIFMLPKITLDTTPYRFTINNLVIQCGLLESTYDADEWTFPVGNKPTQIGSYTPKNKKLLTSEYIYLLMDNGVGGIKKYNFEDFNVASGSSYDINFDYISTPTPSGSVIIAPRNYKGVTQNLLESFAGGKYPMCSWAGDPYTNWLTQSAINREFTYGKDIAQTLTGIGLGTLGALTGNVPLLMAGGGSLGSGLGSGIHDIAENMMQKKEHQIAPAELKGHLSLGDVAFAHFRTIPKYYYMSIKEEYARIIDDFYTRFGYKINRVKVPNITGRTYWNFVKIGNGEDIGNGTIPNKFKESLNQIFRNGTTIWHSHDNIGNFNLSNTIVS